MDIMNYLPEGRYEDVGDLLAFISIYDDRNRTNAYYELLEDNAAIIENAVCADLGAGTGIMTEKMLELGAAKVYVVEKNPYLYDLCRKKLKPYGDKVVFVNKDIRNFVPPCDIKVAVHEFYGQLLFDEEIILLENLKWKPDVLIPDGGKLMCGIASLDTFDDDTVTIDVLKKLDGVLVSGLFDEEELVPDMEVATFEYGKTKTYSFDFELPATKGDLLYFGLVITHRGKEFCRAGICDNWSYVWTYRSGQKFNISFEQQNRGTEVYFSWKK